MAFIARPQLRLFGNFKNGGPRVDVALEVVSIVKLFDWAEILII
jgi:hypothetical protein